MENTRIIYVVTYRELTDEELLVEREREIEREIERERNNQACIDNRIDSLIRKLETKMRSRINNIKSGRYKRKKGRLMMNPIEQIKCLNKTLSDNATRLNNLWSERYKEAKEKLHIEFEAAIKEEINHLETEIFPIDLNALCQEAFKPSRVMYQLSLDPEYYDE